MMVGSPNFSLHVADSAHYLTEQEHALLHEKITQLVQKHCTEQSHIHLDMHEHNKTLKGEKAYHTTLKLVSNKKEFVTTTEQYGSMKSVLEALIMLEEQVKKHAQKQRDIKKQAVKR